MGPFLFQHCICYWLLYYINEFYRVLCYILLYLNREPGSLVSVVSGYGLHDRVIEVRSRQRRKNFSSSLCVQTRSGAYPASCTMGTGGPFLGAKARPGRNADHSPPSSAEVDNE
jgi:hypothetical protein